MNLKFKLLLILCLVAFHDYSVAQSNSNQWDGAIRNWENEIKSEENRLTRLESDLLDAQSRKDKLIQQGYTYEDENLMGDNALRSIDKDIDNIKSSIISCKATIESLRKKINDGREKKRTLEIELERRRKEAQLLEKKKKAELDKQKKDAAQKAKNDAIRAQNEIIEARNAAIRAKEEAEKEAERIADENRRKELGDAAAAEAAAKGQRKIQNRMNNLRESREELQYNIERTNPYDMNLKQRQRLGGDYSRARMSSPNSQNTFDGKQSRMSNMLGNVKSKNVKHDNDSNLDQIEKELKDLLTLIP